MEPLRNECKNLVFDEEQSFLLIFDIKFKDWYDGKTM